MFKNLKGLQEMAETLKQVNGLSKKSPEEIIKSMGNLGIDTTMMEDINKIKMSDFNQDNPKMIGLPEGYELQIRPRSGLAYNHGITVLNTPGTVDRGYTGEVKIILINLSKEDFVINDGDRIAQGVINGILTQRWADFTRVNNLGETSRSDGGFGSTGKK